MMRLAMQILLLFLVVVALLRLYPVVIGALRPPSSLVATLPHEERTQDAHIAQVELFTPPAYESFRHALQAPLFYASRRMPAREEPSNAPQALDLRGLRLLGIVVGAQGGRVLLQRAQEAPRWYAVGERLSGDGWRIAEVGSEHVVLQKGARRVRLLLFSRSSDPR